MYGHAVPWKTYGSDNRIPWDVRCVAYCPNWTKNRTYLYVFKGIYFNVPDFGLDVQDINKKGDNKMKPMKNMWSSG